MSTIESMLATTSATVTGTTLSGGNPALVVRPGSDAPEPCAGVLWLHWLGHQRNDLSELLPEAVALAGEGVVSVLPQGTFPWIDQPAPELDDGRQALAELDRVRAALEHLRSLPGVAADRVAIVGHDYGAMYALALRDPDVRVVVAATPDSSWAHWFLTYWPRGEAPDGYHEQLEGLDPLAAAAGLGSRLVLQWADDDTFVPAHAPELYAQAAPASTALTYPYDHQLGDAAVVDRLRILRDTLGLG